MSFDLLAPHYRWMERILAGEKLQRCRLAHLGKISKAENILILGEGPGRFLAPCLQTFPKAMITVVDSSARMLQQARENVSGAKVSFVHADAREWQPREGGYDLIATHFFLDCFPSEELEDLISKLAGAACPGGRWLISDFAIPMGGLGKVRAQLIHRLMYAFFRVVTKLPARKLTAPDFFLRKNDFQMRCRESFDWGLLQADDWVKA
jgi:ubiquinone/menaquinone biosynthesis C-methylase UbiE